MAAPRPLSDAEGWTGPMNILGRPMTELFVPEKEPSHTLLQG
jgi:hypothetical protein